MHKHKYQLCSNCFGSKGLIWQFIFWGSHYGYLETAQRSPLWCSIIRPVGTMDYLYIWRTNRFYIKEPIYLNLVRYKSRCVVPLIYLATGRGVRIRGIPGKFPVRIFHSLSAHFTVPEQFCLLILEPPIDGRFWFPLLHSSTSQPAAKTDDHSYLSVLLPLHIPFSCYSSSSPSRTSTPFI